MSRSNELEGVIIQRGGIDDKKCNLFGACVDVCPQGAIRYSWRRPGKAKAMFDNTDKLSWKEKVKLL